MNAGSDNARPRAEDSGRRSFFRQIPARCFRCGNLRRTLRAMLLVAAPLILTAVLLYAHHILLLDLLEHWRAALDG